VLRLLLLSGTEFLSFFTAGIFSAPRRGCTLPPGVPNYGKRCQTARQPGHTTIPDRQASQSPYFRRSAGMIGQRDDIFYSEDALRMPAFPGTRRPLLPEMSG